MNRLCNKCGLDFTPTQYQIKKSYWVCQSCRKAQDKINLQKRKAAGKSTSGTKMPPEYHAAYQEKYKEKPGVRERKAEQMRKYRRGPNRHKHEARWILNHAIESGKMERQPCSVCGDTKSEAHHEDYLKPLDVMWFCRKHHREYHAKARGQV